MKAILMLGVLAVLTTFTFGVKIQCSFSNWYWGAGIGQVYGCQAKVTAVETPTYVTEISGTHVAGKANADVKGFFMLDNGNLI